MDEDQEGFADDNGNDIPEEQATEQKIIPFSFNVFLKVVATETESTIISIAILFIFCCSSNEIPSFLYISKSSGSTSSKVVNVRPYSCASQRKISSSVATWVLE